MFVSKRIIGLLTLLTLVCIPAHKLDMNESDLVSHVLIWQQTMGCSTASVFNTNQPSSDFVQYSSVIEKTDTLCDLLPDVTQFFIVESSEKCAGLWKRAGPFTTA